MHLSFFLLSNTINAKKIRSMGKIILARVATIWPSSVTKSFRLEYYLSAIISLNLTLVYPPTPMVMFLVFQRNLTTYCRDKA